MGPPNPHLLLLLLSLLGRAEQRRAGQGEAGVEVALEGRAGQGEAGVEVAGFPTTKDVRRLTWGSRFGLYRWLRAFGATGWLAR